MPRLLACLLFFFFCFARRGDHARATSGHGAANAKRGEGRPGVQAERADHCLRSDQHEGRTVFGLSHTSFRSSDGRRAEGAFSAEFILEEAPLLRGRRPNPNQCAR